MIEYWYANHKVYEDKSRTVVLPRYGEWLTFDGNNYTANQAYYIFKDGKRRIKISVERGHVYK